MFAKNQFRCPLCAVVCLAVAGMWTPSAVVAQTTVIDFESLPGGVPPTHGAAITDQFADPADGGVIFSIDGADPANPNDALFLGDYGGVRDGWQSNFGIDTLAPGLDFGQFFLAHPDAGHGATSIRDVLIDYVNPVHQLGFYLMDLDFTEAWEVTVYDASNSVLASATYDVSDGGDARATHVVFDQTGGTPISRIRLHFSGSPSGGIGFGFDDFTPAAVPEPTSLMLLVLGGLALARRWR